MVKSVLPVRGVTTGAEGGLVRKSMSRAHRPADRHRHTQTHTHTHTHTHTQQHKPHTLAAL